MKTEKYQQLMVWDERIFSKFKSLNGHLRNGLFKIVDKYDVTEYRVQVDESNHN